MNGAIPWPGRRHCRWHLVRRALELSIWWGCPLELKGTPPNVYGLSWFIMVYHGLSWFIVVYHGLSRFIIEIHWSSRFHIFSLIQTYAYEHIYTYVLKCIPFKGVKCVNYIHIHTRYMCLTQLNHCFDGQCAPCPLSWPGFLHHTKEVDLFETASKVFHVTNTKQR